MKSKFKKLMLLSITTATLLGLTSCKKNTYSKTETSLVSIFEDYNKSNEIKNTVDTIVLDNDQMFVDWSWQKFLWLTSNTEDNVPVFMKELKQVNDFGEEIKIDSLKKKGLPSSYIKDGKLPLILDLYQQADATKLSSKSDSLVRYSIHANDGILEMFNSADASSIISQAAEMLKKRKFDSIRESKNQYPVGATEIKIAWIKTSEVVDSTKTFNITAIVNQPNKNLYENYNNAELQRMSMIGFHIFTVTAEHPEGVWSTFDQRDLVPDRTSFHGDPVNSKSDKYTLFNGNSVGNTEDGIIQDATTLTPKVKNKVFQSHPEGVRYNQKSQGMEVIKEDKEFATMIKSSNELAKKALTNDKVKIWANYKLVGSIWSKTNAPINELLDGNLSKPYGTGNGQSFGSLNLANVTMETTFQTEGRNCFTCHSMNNNLYRTDTLKTINVKSPLINSHLFEKYAELKAALLASQGAAKTYTNKKLNTNTIKSSNNIDEINKLKNSIRESSREEARELLKK
jgi:hypothetical protein